MEIVAASTIRTRIASIGRGEASRQEQIQAVCVQIIGHGLKNGANPLGTLLLAKLPAASRAEGRRPVSASARAVCG